MRFLYVVRGGAAAMPELPPAARQANLAKWHAWVGQLTVDPGGVYLQSAGRTLRGPIMAVTDTPHADGQERITGTLIVVAEDLDQAARLALGCPVFGYGGSVEVRPIAAR